MTDHPTGERALFAALGEALDAMPNKRLIRLCFLREGESCALGVLWLSRNPDMRNGSPAGTLQRAFSVTIDVTSAILRQNDTVCRDLTSEARWVRMRAWAKQKFDVGGGT